MEVINSTDASIFVQVIAFKAGTLLESFGNMDANGQSFPYDAHEVSNGVNVSVEIMSWRIEPLDIKIEPKLLDSNVYLIPYSGFCFPRKSNDVTENYQFESGSDDHLFYQGKEVRGIELLAFGKTKEEAIERARAALLGEEVQKISRKIRELKYGEGAKMK